jgi:hypothetical protein
MPESEEQRAGQAATATEDQITLYLHDPSPPVVTALLENRHITEEHVLVIAQRRNLPGRVLDRIFKNKRWTASYPVRMALARNPKTPLFSALSLARYLRLFDLADIARDHLLPVIYRRKIEAIVIEKIPSLALGVKKSLAKTATGEILLSLIQNGYPDVVSICLDNPHLVEAHLYKVISRSTSTPGTIRSIAQHRNWSSRYPIKFALVRNEHTPLSRSVHFLTDLKSRDLRELYRDPLLPPSVRPLIHRELMGRGEDPDTLAAEEQEHVFEIEEGDLDEIERDMHAYLEDREGTAPPPEPSGRTGQG